MISFLVDPIMYKSKLNFEALFSHPGLNSLFIWVCDFQKDSADHFFFTNFNPGINIE